MDTFKHTQTKPYITKKTVYIAAMLLAINTSACLRVTPVSPSPLPKAQLGDLACSLVGTWKLTSIDDEVCDDGLFEQHWVFHADGTGTYVQRKGHDPGINMLVAQGDQPFYWTLKGRNIRLAGSGLNTYYRADHWSPQKMQWFNYTNSDHYTVMRTEVGDYNNCINTTAIP